jgi:HJR/Mrr/RecB family endonuclease
MNWLIENWTYIFGFLAVVSLIFSNTEYGKRLLEETKKENSEIDSLLVDLSVNDVLTDRKIETLNPEEFEHYVAGCIELLPKWRAFKTGKSGDRGCDVEAISPGGEKVVIQVKHTKNRVLPSVIRATAESKRLFNAKYSIVVTSGPDFSNSTKFEAKQSKVDLWTTRQLRHLKEISYGIRDDLPSPLDKMK